LFGGGCCGRLNTGQNKGKTNTPHICIVEDYPDAQVLLSRMIESGGIEASVAGSGRDLDQLLQSGVRPDLFLVDLSLPGETGLSIRQRLRTDPRFANTPVVAITAHAYFRDKREAIAMGFDGYLTKPVDVATLLSTVRHLLRPPSALEMRRSQRKQG